MNVTPIRTLLVEDNPGDVRLVEMLIGEALVSRTDHRPFELEAVDRLDAAQQALDRSRFDVVLLDLSLPDSQGLATLAGVLAHAKAVPIVVLSGTSDERIALQAVEEGAQDYLTKGQFDGSLLLRAIRYAIERQRVEGALRESEARHRKMFQSNPLPMWVYDSSTLRILAVNQTATQHYGYTEKEFLSMTLRELRPPEELARFDESMNEPAMDKAPSEIWRHRKKNGDIISVDISADSIQFEGRPARLVLANDITERQRLAWEEKRLHAELNKSAREWKVTFDALDIPVLLIGMDGQILRMNRAGRELTGRDYSDAVGHPLPGDSGIFPWPKVLALTMRAANGKTQAAAQLTDHASRRIWDCLAAYFESPETGAGNVVFHAREITNLVKLQESLRRGELMSTMGALVSGVAHEVRNPLFGIIATLDAFQANHGDRPEFSEYLDILRGEATRLSTLMSELLDYGRPPSLTRSRGSPAGVFDRALEANRALAEKLGVMIEADIASGLPKLNFDPQRLGQVFLNLLDNAIHHSPPGRTVRLRAGVAPDRSCLECSVLDEGPGVKPEDLPRLFQPFFTRRAGGTGLGLAICQRIVEQHGGTISAANRPEGGAAFTVKLPLAGLSD